MCGKTLGQLFDEVNERIEALEERVEQLEAEQRAPAGWQPDERWAEPYSDEVI